MTNQIPETIMETSTDNPSDSETGSDSWIGYNDPDTRGLIREIEPWMINGQQLTLSPKQVLMVYIALARMHDLEKFGYQRDFESIATYCPRHDDSD